MLIDILYALLLFFAVWNGWRRGLIVGVFSLVAIIIGLAAAMKLSIVVANYLGKSLTVSATWLPFISFILVFVLIVLLIRLAAKAIEKAVETVLMGWVNKLGGILLYAAVYTLIFSVLLFYLVQIQWFQPQTIKESATYPFVQPWGPKVIDGFGSLIPLFKDMFEKLQEFFGTLADKIST